jgi:hypothetical protein
VVEVQHSGGGPSSRLDPGQLGAALGSEPAAVREVLAIPPGEWTVLVYVDTIAARAGEVARAAEALAAASAELAQLGPSTLVVADTLLDTWVDGSEDADELRESFEELAATSFPSPPGARAPDVARRRELLLEELGRRPHGSGARLLVVVGDPNAERIAGSGDAGAGGPAGDRAAVAVQVAALGWVALPLHGLAGAMPAVSPLAEESGGEVVADASSLAASLARLRSRRLMRIEQPRRAATTPSRQAASGGEASYRSRSPRPPVGPCAVRAGWRSRPRTSR